MDILNAIATGFFLSFMVGPVFFVLLETSATKGIKQAIIFDLGVIFADIVFITLSYYGSYLILNKLKDDPRLFIGGGLVLFTYGLISFIKEKRRKVIMDPELVIVEKSTWYSLFIKGFLLNFINIGVLAFWLAIVVVVSTNVAMNPVRVFWYFAFILIAYFVTDLGKIVLAKQLKNKLTPKIINKIRKTIGIILMVIGLTIIFKTYIPKQTMDQINNKVEEVMEKVK